MQDMIFVNVPVADLPKSMTFWRALGFEFNMQYTDETAACLVLSPSSYAMLLTHAKFREFALVEPADTGKAREVLVAFNRASPAEVDRIANAAAQHGGAAHGAPQDHGFMYYRSFTDPDGHIWEVIHFPEQPN